MKQFTEGFPGKLENKRNSRGSSFQNIFQSYLKEIEIWKISLPYF
jgi:hypothetical protein